MRTIDSPLLLRIPEVAQHLGVSRHTVYRMIEAGTLPAVEMPTGLTSCLRVRQADLDNFVGLLGKPAPAWKKLGPLRQPATRRA